MQLVIEINDKIYKEILNGKDGWSNYVHGLIRVGTLLPKGHGDLIDRSDLIPDSDYEDGIFYAVSTGAINGAPTIVEADKEESEVEE